MKGKKIEITPIGMAHGRPDIERLGLFAELGYLIGKKYTPVLTFSNVRDPKKRQMFPGGSKLKTGLQDCYFDSEFRRLFIGEGYPRKRKSDKKDKKKKKEIDMGPFKPFIPSKYPNPLYYRGDAFGYFSYTEEFSPKARKKPKYEKEPRGIYSSAPKFGGPGYVDMCLNPYPIHLRDLYEARIKRSKDTESKKFSPMYLGQPPNLFDLNPFGEDFPQGVYKKTKEVYIGKIGPTFKYSSPAKWDGGCKEGTFEKFPEYVEDRYNDPSKIDKVLQKIRDKKNKKKEKKDKKGKGPVFMPPACCKTLQTPSVIDKNIDIHLNNNNWTEAEALTYTRTYEII